MTVKPMVPTARVNPTAMEMRSNRRPTRFRTGPTEAIFRPAVRRAGVMSAVHAEFVQESTGMLHLQQPQKEADIDADVASHFGIVPEIVGHVFPHAVEIQTDEFAA